MQVAGEDRAVLKRFVVAFVMFAGLILSGAFALALLAAKAYPAAPPTVSCRINAVATMAASDEGRALHTFAPVPWQ